MIIRHSMIEQYLSCHRKFYNVHILGQGEKQTSSALAFGTAMHLVPEAHFNGDDPFRAFNMYWEAVKSQHLEYDQFDWDTLRKMANDSFIPKFLKGPAKKMKDVKTEITMSAPILGEHTLQGTADWVGDFDGEFTLGDWKTSKSRYNPSKIYRSLQMYIYAYLYEKTHGRIPDYIRYTVFVKTDRGLQNNLKLRLTKEMLDSRMAIVESIVKDIVSRDIKDESAWYPNPSCFCTGKCFIGGS